MGIEEELKQETQKWLEKIKHEREKIELGKSKVDFVKNIDAYISDSQHFLKKNDYIRAFEAVIWAWAYLEIGQQEKLIKNNS